jgi:hypothetical protein
MAGEVLHIAEGHAGVEGQRDRVCRNEWGEMRPAPPAARAARATNCSAATLASGDKGNDRRMEPGETWLLTCKAERPDQPVQARAYALDPLGQATTAVPDK